MTAAALTAGRAVVVPRTRERVVTGLFFASLFVATFEKVHWSFGGQIGINDITTILFLIATVAYDIASENVYSLIFFLGMISINLAVINFLPIPVLDGGHMLFLIWEKIRGVPASQSVQAVATYVGLLVILALMVLTFWVDITRLF